MSYELYAIHPLFLSPIIILSISLPLPSGKSRVPHVYIEYTSVLNNLIFTNAIRAAAILKNGDREEFKRLKEHIRRGVYDVSTDDMPMLQPGEKRLYKYVAGGDAMLLDYCNLLNEEVSMTLHFLSNYF